MSDVQRSLRAPAKPASSATPEHAARSARSGAGRGAHGERRRSTASGDGVFRACASLASLLAVVRDRGDRLPGDRRRQPSHLAVRPGLPGALEVAAQLRNASAPPRFMYGTAVTSAGALVLAVPIGVSIGLYLSTVASAPRAQRDRAAGGDAGGDPERHPRVLGHPRASAPFLQVAPRAVRCTKSSVSCRSSDRRHDRHGRCSTRA